MGPSERAPDPLLCRRPVRGRCLVATAPLAGTSRPESLHRARSAVAAVGLGRRPPDGPERLPSDRPGPCGPSGLGHACCSRASPRPAPGRSLRALFCPVKGKRVASSYPALPRTASPSPARGSGGDPQHDWWSRSPRERCVSPTSATDSRHEHPAVRSIPGRALARAAPRGVSRLRARTHPGREPRRRGLGNPPVAYRMSQPGGASLDGEPPASASAATIT